MAVDEETARWLFYEIAEQHCQSCGKQLTWANRGREGRGAWEIHHIGAGRTAMERTFRGVIDPDMPIYLRVICWDCHKNTF